MKFQRVGEVNFMKVSVLSPPPFPWITRCGFEKDVYQAFSPLC